MIVFCRKYVTEPFYINLLPVMHPYLQTKQAQTTNGVVASHVRLGGRERRS